MIENLSQADHQNSIYYIILLAILISSLFFRRELKLSQAIKYLAWWSIIAIIVVIIYSYRYEFSDFKNRILGEINPTAARVIDNQIIINLSQDGHFYVDTKINGKALRFMIDTGASDIVINPDEAKKIGIDLDNLRFDRHYQTANGTVYGASISIQEIEISGVKFNNIPASINGADMGTSLLGMRFLRQFKKYEFYQDKLILTF